ncbi:MAG: outer membrane protein assembly factor BamB family protein [Acidobacteriaceae bacterium]
MQAPPARFIGSRGMPGRIVSAVALACGGCLLAGCSSAIYSNKMPGQTFPQASTFRWVQQGNIGYSSPPNYFSQDFAGSVLLMADQSVTVAGMFLNGNNLLLAQSPPEGFLANYSATGQAGPTMQLKKSIFFFGNAPTTATPDGNLVAAGEVPTTPGNSASLIPLEVEKFEASGTTLWKSQLDATAQLPSYYPATIATDTQGDIYVGGLLPVAGNASVEGIFLAKLDGSTGTLLWRQQFIGTQKCWLRGMATGPNDNLYVVGAGDGSFPGMQPMLGNTTANFVAKFNGASGQYVWTDSSVQQSYDSVAVSASGNVFTAGQSGVNLSVAQFSPRTGIARWQRYFSANSVGSELTPSNMTTDTGGNVLIVGSTNGFVSTTGGSASRSFASSSTSAGLFVAKLDSSGQPAWLQNFGPQSGVTGGSSGLADPPFVVTDSQNNIYVAGNTTGAFTGFQNSQGQVDFFLAKFGP